MLGVNIGGSSGEESINTNVYRNFIYGCVGSIHINNHNDNTLIAFNVIYDPMTTGDDPDKGGIWEGSTNIGAYIVNNTIYEGSGTAQTAIYLSCNGGTTVKNNVVVWDDADDYVFYAGTCGDPAVLSSNIWYNPSNSDKVFYESTAYGTANWSTWTASHTGESYADPLLADPANGDFTLTSTSPCINVGTDPFVNGDGDQTDMAGETVWDDTQDRPVGTWRDGVDIGAYGYYLESDSGVGVSISGASIN